MLRIGDSYSQSIMESYLGTGMGGGGKTTGMFDWGRIGGIRACTCYFVCRCLLLGWQVTGDVRTAACVVLPEELGLQASE